MAYQIHCLKCDTDTWAGNIVDLIDAHTNLCGWLICAQCGETETYVQQITGRWEKEPDAVWDRYIRGVLPLATESPMYVPYVFLTADSPKGEVSQLHFGYYTRPGPTGRLSDGPGPGQAPALTLDDLRQLLVKLGAFGVLRAKELEVLAQLIRLDAPTHAFA
jgi:hypothetical protein